MLSDLGGVVTLEGHKNGSSGDVASEEGALDDGDRASRGVARTSASRAECSPDSDLTAEQSFQ